jgi:hypothetical protein
VEDVRAACAGERAPLLDSETVLLVDDRDREVRQLYTLLDQGVRAHDDVRRDRPLPLALRHRVRDEAARHAELAAEPLDREEVLLGERLGRRHQRALTAVLDRSQQRVERDDGLPRADVALQQALHRHRPREIRIELRDRALLVDGQPEGEHLAVTLDQPPHVSERRCDLALPLAPALRDPDLEHEQLVEGEPPPSGLRLLERARPVQRPQRVDPLRQALTFLQRGRQRIRERRRQRRLDELAELPRRDLLARRIHRREVGRCGRLAEVVRLDVEPEPTLAAAEPDVRSRLELPFQPRLVEPGRRHGGRPVGDPRRQHLEPAAAPLPHRQHLAGNRDLLVAVEIRDPHLVDRPLVAEGPVA